MPRLLPSVTDGRNFSLMNIVLLGHDQESLQQDNVFRTDTMIVVSVNTTTNTVSMLALPRDLLVYVPNWGMQRLNLAWGRGESIGWTDGGWGMFRQAVLYNFGIELHYYAMVDFSGFQAIINVLEGVTIAVDCPVRGYLFTGEYDAEQQPIFELTTLPIGVHHLNSREALWYARTRSNSTDFDRGRRQQQLLRAIWAQSRDLGLLSQLPSLWNDMLAVVDTNVPLEVVLQLAPLGLTLEPNAIENHFFRLNIESRSWTTPSGDNVQLPNGAMITMVQNFLTPPTQNRLVTDAARIHIYDGSGQDARWDAVAADRLIWEGLLAQPQGPAEAPYAETVIIDYTGATKGSSLEELARVLNVRADQVQFEPDPNRTADFEVFLGANYSSCFEREVQVVEYAPPATPTPAP
ncbi:MAG: LCP family protein [Anaerolineae bacterium]|nr:LCP family protein [Anaerolineae bacterium]